MKLWLSLGPASRLVGVDPDMLRRWADEGRGGSGTGALDEATELSVWLGARLTSSGTSLTESVALFVAARRPFMGELGTLARRRRLDSREIVELFDAASAALDRCPLAFIDGHRRVADAEQERRCSGPCSSPSGPTGRSSPRPDRSRGRGPCRRG